MLLNARSLLAPLAFILAAGLLSAVHAQALSMGGGFIGGTFNDFVDGIARVVEEDTQGVTITPTASAGSVENLRRIMAGDMDMAVAFAGDAFVAFNRLEAFDDDEAANTGIRAIGYLYPAVSQVVTLADSGIETVSDLIGKRLAVGEIGSGTHLSMRRYLAQAGVLGDVALVFVGGRAASEMLLDGRVDAYHALLGVPNATVEHSAAAGDIRILETLGDAMRNGFFDSHPYYLPYVIHAGTYQGVDQDVLTWKDAALWIVSADLDEDTAYQMVSAVYGEAGIDRMRQTTTVAESMGVATAIRGVVMPLHEGAARYWREAGVQFPAAARPLGD